MITKLTEIAQDLVDSVKAAFAAVITAVKAEFDKLKEKFTS